MAPKRKATIIALANQKGGVAKTTSVASLGAAFAEQGRRVLLVDLDPQACLTFSLGVDPDAVEASIHDVLLGSAPLSEVITRCEDGVDLVPSSIDLAGAEAILLSRPAREYVLKGALDTVRKDYDVILLDCSPSLGVLTLNALTAAQGLIIPMPCEMLSHRGVGQLLDTVRDVRKILNKKLRVIGILPTLYDGRSNHSKEVLDDVGERYDLPVLSPPIPKTVRFAEAPAVGRSILSTASIFDLRDTHYTGTHLGYPRIVNVEDPVISEDAQIMTQQPAQSPYPHTACSLSASPHCSATPGCVSTPASSARRLKSPPARPSIPSSPFHRSGDTPPCSNSPSASLPHSEPASHPARRPTSGSPPSTLPGSKLPPHS